MHNKTKNNISQNFELKTFFFIYLNQTPINILSKENTLRAWIFKRVAKESVNVVKKKHAYGCQRGKWVIILFMNFDDSNALFLVLWVQFGRSHISAVPGALLVGVWFDNSPTLISHPPLRTPIQINLFDFFFWWKNLFDCSTGDIYIQTDPK